MVWHSHIFGILLAPFIGSFLGVLIARLPEGRPIVFDRSRCEACGQTLDTRVSTWQPRRFGV